MAGQEGIEPPTGGFGIRCSTAELLTLNEMVEKGGIEPPPRRFSVHCSTPELQLLNVKS
jgi:hypothetical protein